MNNSRRTLQRSAEYVIQPSISSLTRQEVGAANAANSISIVIACHQAIGANGKLTGYGGGLHKKELLLELEGVKVDRSFFV